MKTKLFGKTLEELTEITSQLELPGYKAKQIADWLYKKHVSSFAEMTNIGKNARNKLDENYDVGLSSPVKFQLSKDGTKKYLFLTEKGKYIESAFIPEINRKTLCISSQVGCKMGCLFCMTGQQGFQGNLSVNEILNQVHSIPETNELTNLVFMGMGEPFDNFGPLLKSLQILTSDYGYAMSPRRITVSSIGILPEVIEFLDKSQCHLAISLHSPFHEERKKLMPVQNIYPIDKIIEALKNHDFERQRRISFEYIVFRELNDTPRHVNELAKLLNGLRCRINLIRYHPIPGTPLKSTNEEILQTFKDQLNLKGIRTTIRASRGMDIYAACGLLSTKELVKNY